jgi:predicted aspartyl protease
MRRAYSRAFDPPAPVVPVLVKAVGPGRERRLDAKLDTGADICALPDVLIAELALPASGSVRAAGYGGEFSEVLVYRAEIRIGEVVHRDVKAVSTRRPYAIVGRNLLKEYLLSLNGPASRLDLRRP